MEGRQKLLVLVASALTLGFSVPVTPAHALSDPFVLERDRVGLNVHWALGGFDMDEDYRRTLRKSGTTWAREHFSTEVLIYASEPSAWFDRYDQVMEEYEKLGINVVGMLAYGPTPGDFQKPRPGDWELMVRKVVQRYKDQVKVWEVWNEPDSPTYLTPHNPETFQPIMEQAYTLIKEIQPEAIVLNGGLASPNADFAKQMLENYGASFDAFAFHVYTCRDPNHDSLIAQLEQLREVMVAAGRTDNAWVTEIGCSTESPGITRERQAAYLQEAGEILFDTGWIERIFVYNIRDRDIDDAYENQFGLWDLEFRPYPAWHWYRKLAIGPYGLQRLDRATEQVKEDRLAGKLARFFPQGLPDRASKQWAIAKNAWIYGRYPQEAIVQFIRYGGARAVHSTLPYNKWSASPSYRAAIAKDFVDGKPIFVYRRPRKTFAEERESAQMLKQKLEQKYDLASLHIDAKNWSTLVNAYLYGNYPVDAIARAMVFGGKTVHPTIAFAEWSRSTDYQDFIAKSIPKAKK